MERLRSHWQDWWLFKNYYYYVCYWFLKNFYEAWRGAAEDTYAQVSTFVQNA